MHPHGRIKVLHLIGTLSPGGAERNLYYLAPNFAKSEFSYSICCLMRKGSMAEEIENYGVPVYELGFRRRYTIQTILKLKRLLKEKQITILHTHLFEPGFIGRIAAWLAGTPVIITHEHGKTLWKRWYHRLFERLALARTDMRIVVSRDIMQLRALREGTPASKLVLIENAVDPRPFEIAQSRRAQVRQKLGLDGYFVIGTVGRLIEAKCYDKLLQVAANVYDANQSVRFLIIGDGPLSKRLRQLAKELKVGGVVKFLGQRDDIPDLLSAIDLYVITSQREGLPVSLIEAMMAGKPIVATAVGGIPEAISSGKDGILIEPARTEQMHETILKLIESPDERERLGANAKEKALRKYSPESVLAKIENLYREILSRKAIPLPRRA